MLNAGNLSKSLPNQEMRTNRSLSQLNSFCKSLLYTTEVLLNERNQLYNAHIEILRDGKTSKLQLVKRLNIENDLAQIYAELLNESGKSSGSPNMTIMNKPIGFAIYSLMFWILGLITAFYAYQYVANRDILVSLHNPSTISF